MLNRYKWILIFGFVSIFLTHIPFGTEIIQGKPNRIVQLTNTESVQKEAAQKEINQIQIRNRVRDLQLKQSVQLYVKLKNQAEIMTYKNQFKTYFMQESSLKITRDIFMDQIADQQRYNTLK